MYYFNGSNKDEHVIIICLIQGLACIRFILPSLCMVLSRVIRGQHVNSNKTKILSYLRTVKCHVGSYWSIRLRVASGKPEGSSTRSHAVTILSCYTEHKGGYCDVDHQN